MGTSRPVHLATAFLAIAIALPAHAQTSFAQLKPAGLQGKKVTALGAYGSIYASTDQEGVFRLPLFSNDSAWVPMGLEGKRILTTYPHKYGPIGFAVSAGVEPDWSHGDSALVYCSIFDRTEWAVTDSGMPRASVPWIKSLDGFPDPTICGETFAAGPGTIFRRYFLSPHWEQVFDIGVGVTNVIRADEYSAQVWAGGGTAIRMPWLARTKDKGVTWEVSFPSFDFLTTCRAIAIHPADANIVYAGLEEAVAKTTDGGKNWQLASPRYANVAFDALLLAPFDPDHILAGGSQEGSAFLMESFDAGKNWHAVFPPIIPDPPIPVLHAITSLLTAPDTLGAYLIGTLGEGVWRYNSLPLGVAAGGQASLPTGFMFEQNYPNPFNPETEIRYRIARPQHVELTVFDLAGRLVVTLVEAQHPAGDFKTRWNGRDGNGASVPSGIYFCQLRLGRDVVATRKMTLLR